jgi:hypothetical protein
LAIGKITKTSDSKPGAVNGKRGRSAKFRADAPADRPATFPTGRWFHLPAPARADIAQREKDAERGPSTKRKGAGQSQRLLGIMKKSNRLSRLQFLAELPNSTRAKRKEHQSGGKHRRRLGNYSDRWGHANIVQTVITRVIPQAKTHDGSGPGCRYS